MTNKKVTTTTTTVTTVVEERDSNEAVEIVMIVDRSGSMSSIANDAIGGYNTFLKEQKAVDGKANLTLVLFDDQIETPIDSMDIQSVPELNSKTYVPRGSTAMNDAIGSSLAKLEEKNPSKAIICILTDGEENASREYSLGMIKERIKKAEDRGWQIQYLAANQDAFSVGTSIGISGNNTKGFAANSAGVLDAYACLSSTTRSYRSSFSKPDNEKTE